jgi:hypothetical protein
MTLEADAFIRRFLLHVLPERLPPHPPLWLPRQPRTRGNHRSPKRLIAAADPGDQSPPSSNAPHKAAASPSATICPCCGGRVPVVETFARGAQPGSFMAEPADTSTLTADGR